MIMERCTQKVISTNKEAYELEIEFDALESKLEGVPQKRRYWAGYCSLPANTMVWERDWPSLAAVEAYNQTIAKDPEWRKLFEKANKVYTDLVFEIFRGITLRE